MSKYRVYVSDALVLSGDLPWDGPARWRGWDDPAIRPLIVPYAAGLASPGDYPGRPPSEAYELPYSTFVARNTSRSVTDRQKIISERFPEYLNGNGVGTDGRYRGACWVGAFLTLSTPLFEHPSDAMTGFVCDWETSIFPTTGISESIPVTEAFAQDLDNRTASAGVCVPEYWTIDCERFNELSVCYRRAQAVTAMTAAECIKLIRQSRPIAVLGLQDAAGTTIPARTGTGSGAASVIGGPTFGATGVSTGASGDVAANFDGTDDAVSVPSGVSASQSSWALACAFNADVLPTTGATRTILSVGNDSGQSIRLSLNNTSGTQTLQVVVQGVATHTTTLTPVAGTNYVVVVKVASGTMKVWVNSRVPETPAGTWTAASNLTGSVVLVGARKAGVTPDQWFDGRIAFAAWWAGTVPTDDQAGDIVDALAHAGSYAATSWVDNANGTSTFTIGANFLRVGQVVRFGGNAGGLLAGRWVKITARAATTITVQGSTGSSGGPLGTVDREMGWYCYAILDPRSSTATVYDNGTTQYTLRGLVGQMVGLPEGTEPEADLLNVIDARIMDTIYLVVMSAVRNAFSVPLQATFPEAKVGNAQAIALKSSPKYLYNNNYAPFFNGDTKLDDLFCLDVQQDRRFMRKVSGWSPGNNGSADWQLPGESQQDAYHRLDQRNVEAQDRARAPVVNWLIHPGSPDDFGLAPANVYSPNSQDIRRMIQRSLALGDTVYYLFSFASTGPGSVPGFTVDPEALLSALGSETLGGRVARTSRNARTSREVF